MQSNNDYLHKVCNNICPDDLGVIWLEDNPLSDKSDYYFEMNYLVDGLLSQSSTQDSEGFNFFLTQQFSNQFFLIFKNCTEGLDTQKLINVISNSPNINDKNKSIVIVCNSQKVKSKNIQDQLAKKFNNLCIKNLNL